MNRSVTSTTRVSLIVIGVLTVVGLLLRHLEKQISELRIFDAKINNNHIETHGINARRFAEVEGNEQCLSGHVQDFAPVCGGDGCLRTLSHGPNVSHMRDRFQEPDTMAFIHNISGWCNANRHAPIARELSIMQWENSIYGAVGEIGVYMGKYSAILGFVTNTQLGERFFAGDIFENKTKVSVDKRIKGRYTTFLETMDQIGFSVRAKDPTKRLYTYFDSSIFLSKLLFVRLNLPAFRLLSIDGDHNRPAVLNDFEKAACVMRKGGIIIFDDAYSHDFTVKEAIQDFFDYYGSDAFKPLLYSTNKLYVCTSDFYPTFMEYIRTHIAQKYNMVERDEKIFVGKGHRYFVL